MRMFGIFGKKAKYKTFNWFENFMGGHINIGNITIYGANAMCWAVNISTKKYGYICFSLPSIRRKKYKYDNYFYLSPNATPWACTYYLGSNKYEKVRAQIRKIKFGHNYNSFDEKISKELRKINDFI